MSAGSVAPAQVGANTEPLLPSVTSVSPSEIAQELLGSSDQLAVPAEPAPQAAAHTPAPDSDSVDPEADLPTLVAQLRSADPGSREMECLAVGIYFESKGEPLIGQLAVGEVIVNRAESGRFPSTYCGVLVQRKQFSFVRGKSWPKVARQSRAWKTAVAIAKIVDQDLKDSKAGNALFFHARRVSPGWKMKRVASIGNHIFYR
ncbi:MAG TPA: cell wall hydrolase [Sphingomicrobium sp.]|nr:cell wall hydrolase [Sphingomicrobium sp.]